MCSRETERREGTYVAENERERGQREREKVYV